jgi:mannose-6-phosphate isomerase-like protein (cupin superfamily)
MKLLRLCDLDDVRDGHFLPEVIPGAYLNKGGLTFKAPGERTHTADGPGGADRHVHEDCEVFLILQGRAEMEIDGQRHPLSTGDVCVVEPGEDHHLIADQDDPCVSVWLHAGPSRHPDQSRR